MKLRLEMLHLKDLMISISNGFRSGKPSKVIFHEESGIFVEEILAPKHFNILSRDLLIG